MPAGVELQSLLKVSPADPSIDAIYEAFDGRDCDIDGARCRVAVYGVHDDGHSRWVQLSLEGLRQTMVTLRLASSEPGPGLVSNVV